MKPYKNIGKGIIIYAILLGGIYIVVGSVEFVTAFWNWFIEPEGNLSFLGLPSDDLFGGFVALVIGTVFLGVAPLWKTKYKPIGFILVGALLSVTFGAIYLLIAGADGFEAFLAYLSGEEWTWEWLTAGTASSNLLRPEIWLAFLSAPLGYMALKAAKTK